MLYSLRQHLGDVSCCQRYRKFWPIMKKCLPNILLPSLGCCNTSKEIWEMLNYLFLNRVIGFLIFFTKKEKYIYKCTSRWSFDFLCRQILIQNSNFLAKITLFYLRFAAKNDGTCQIWIIRVKFLFQLQNPKCLPKSGFLSGTYNYLWRKWRWDISKQLTGKN